MTRIAILAAGLCGIATAVAAASAPVPAKPPREAPASRPSDREVRARADALIARMTPEEKAGQLVTLFALPIPVMMKAAEKQVADGTVGSLLFVTDPKETNRLQRIAVEGSRLKIPLLFGFDVVHGFSTIFPVPIAGAASWDPAMAAANQSVAAAEARAVGIHWAFAPMVDIARDPRWGRIVEGAGEDPYLGSAMAAAQVRGFQGPAIGSPGHIIAGPKHFAGYGAALGGRDYDEVNLSDADLWNVYLPPFKAAVDAGAGNIMSAYMGVNGIPATANRWLLKTVLRDTWGFDGFVVSDNEAVKNLKTHGLAADATDAGVRALDAGVDMEMALFGPAFARLPAALKEGRITAAQLDDAVRFVLSAKIRMGLFERPYVDEKRAATTLRAPAYLQAARIAAERSAVLLRNENALLPLDRRKVKSVAVIGPLADSGKDTLGPWVFAQNQSPTNSVLQGIRQKVGPGVRVTYEQGVTMPARVTPSPFADVVGQSPRPPVAGGDAAGIARAVELARASDVALLVLGEAQDMIGEAASTSSLDLPGRQQDLLNAVIATGKPVVLLLMNGRPLDLKGVTPGAILDIWYPGSAGGAAVANLLFGDAAPAGKLPFTWPRNVGQVPAYYAHLTSHAPKEVDRRYFNESSAPAWPFGFGLGYSTFAYSNLRIDRAEIAAGDTVTVSVDLRNTGSRAADEVAQLYLHQRSGTAARPVRELKGFQRVALKPGESRTLVFKLGRAEMQYWNAAAHGWVIDRSVFDVGIGGDSTVTFGGTFSVVGAASPGTAPAGQ